MAQFRVNATFTINGRHYLCAVGAVLNGKVRAGMTARLEVAGECRFAQVIDAVEVTLGESGAEPTLVFKYPSDAAAIAARDLLAAGSVLTCHA